MMIYLIGGLSALFIGIGFLLNENNAGSLLAGYNTMSEEEQAKFRLTEFLVFFRQFHVYLGISYLLFGFLIWWLMESSVLGLFIGLYPIFAYMLFIYRAQKFQGSTGRASTWAILVLGLCAIGIVILFTYGSRPNTINLNQEGVVIEGSYGASWPWEQIEEVQLLEELPPLKRRVHGTSMPPIYQGYFQTEEGHRVKLLINSDQRPLIYLNLKGAEDVYFVPLQWTQDEPERLFEKINRGLGQDSQSKTP